ncbi:hypothetical protein EJ08DRAFT_655234 [Tothia fuscella]|uniref:Uncharacterized protein n=1 Tax=Tothia fuscella TaxID=1048955 RepID=A0A9P4P2I7_9PEZI|nr:hypothetical protein EJ08DRAFT_655234 [Tothia fuscella]
MRQKKARNKPGKMGWECTYNVDIWRWGRRHKPQDERRHESEQQSENQLDKEKAKARLSMWQGIRWRIVELRAELRQDKAGCEDWVRVGPLYSSAGRDVAHGMEFHGEDAGCNGRVKPLYCWAAGDVAREHGVLWYDRTESSTSGTAGLRAKGWKRGERLEMLIAVGELGDAD